MGAVDLVIQVESPTSVARGLQRIGRAGHQVGEPSKGVIFPKYRGDLLETAVVVKGMHAGSIEQTVLPRNPLDVLAQQIVAMTIGERFTVDELLELVRRAAPFETLTREVLEGVLGMLAGAYPSDEFAELKPRIVWDRLTDTVEGRRDARVVAVTSGGTIPDRGLFPVFLEGEPGTTGRRVGELDEEMVYELRAGMHGDVVILGASSWRVAEISPNRVTVTPAPGVPGKLPFWKGDTVGRPIELGRAMGAFTREAEADLERGPIGRVEASERLRRDHDLDPLAAENLIAYLEDERGATGVLPTDRRIVVERFRDELGDWRLVVLTPFGGRVHAPWTMALEARLADRLGFEVQTIWSDDGIAIRLPEGESSVDGVEALLFPDPEEVEDLVVGRVGQSSLFASRFRENAARALLLPRRRPGTRTPLWQQRQRAADLLAVASRYGSFPILVETYRECLADVFDLPALREILDGVRRREIAVHAVETPKASAFASSLLFDYIAAVHVRGRRAAGRAPGAGPHAGPRPAARAAGPGGAPGAARRRGARGPRAQPPGPRRRAPRPRPGPGPRPAAAAGRPDDRRGRRPDGRRPARGLAPPRGAGRLAAGGPREDRRRGALDRDGGRRPLPRRRRGGGAARRAAGVPRPRGRPRSTACSRGTRAPTARSWAPSPPAAGACRRAWSRTRSTGWSPRAASCPGEFRPGGAEREYCDPEVLRLLRRRSLAKLRKEVEPVDPVTLARFLPAWQGVAASPSAGCAGSGRAPRARTPWSAWPRSSTSWPACRSRPRSSSATCSRPGSPATSRGCWTSWARWARSPGWGGGASGATTAGWCSTDRAASCCGRPGCPTASSVRRPRSTSGSGPTCSGAARRSTASCTAPRAGGPTARCSTRCGTWSGRARSPTTRSRRSARCAGSVPRRTAGRGPDG